MFEKTKARIAELEETNQTFRNAKQHVEKYRTAYLVGAGCLGAGFVGGKHFQRPIEVTVTPVFNNTVAPIIAPVMNNIGNVVENTINNAGRLHKVIKRINLDGTEDFFETIGDAAVDFAEESGLKPSSARQLISDCINGRKPHVHGLQFETVGIGTR